MHLLVQESAARSLCAEHSSAGVDVFVFVFVDASRESLKEVTNEQWSPPKR